MSHKYRYKSNCPECGMRTKSNLPKGGSSAEEKLLRHRIKFHGYEPNETQRELLRRV